MSVFVFNTVHILVNRFAPKSIGFPTLEYVYSFHFQSIVAVYCIIYKYLYI
uniref:Uncharacterized protein n=1 Tax=Glossina morsitans morsitans TaxID=37546 RepID=A0ABK9NFT1_GLOMM